jgi:hypothetical protein
MRNLAVLAAAGSALALVAAAPAPAQKPKPAPGTQNVTLKASTDLTTYSTPVSLSADVKGAKAAVAVTLQRRASTATDFATATTATTDANGRVTFSQRPSRNTVYRVVVGTTPPAQSAETLVRVRPLVGLRVSDSTPRRGQRVRFSGTVRPQHDGRTVHVQRKRADGSYGTVFRTSLRDAGSAYSSYSRRVTVRRTGTYRVRILGHDDHATGVSRERTLTVG